MISARWLTCLGKRNANKRCPLLAQSGHGLAHCQCPLWGSGHLPCSRRWLRSSHYYFSNLPDRLDLSQLVSRTKELIEQYRRCRPSVKTEMSLLDNSGQSRILSRDHLSANDLRKIAHRLLRQFYDVTHADHSNFNRRLSYPPLPVV